MKNDSPITFSSSEHHNQYTLLISGALLFLVCFYLLGDLDQTYKPTLLLGFLAACFLIFLGGLKLLEPKISLSLSSDILSYFHRHGYWQIHRSNIQRVFQPKISYHLEQKDLPFIGIKLKDVTDINNFIRPRLANRLIHEQQDLLVMAVKLGELTPQQTQLNFSPFTLNNGQIMTGPIAAWLHQMSLLRQVYGCDLLIPMSCLSHEPNHLLKLINHWLTDTFDTD